MRLFDIFNKKKTEAGSDNTEFQKNKDITSKTVKLQLFRFNQELDNWKLGVDNFEDVDNPTNADLITVYNDVVIDAHLSAAINARKSKNLSKDFKIVDEKGEEIEEETAIFNAQWFRDCLSFALDAEYYGHTLIQLGKRVGKSFESVKIVPREYVYAQKKSVRNSPFENENLTPYNRGVFKPWTIEAGRDDSMGLLMKASPLVIFKKTGLGSWAEFTEIFGSPMRVGKTNVRDEALSNNMYDMLDNMGRNAFAVLDTDDEIEFVRDSKQDAYNVFNELIERTNSELSKLILGSTMTLDDGSSKSQSEVHERTTGAIEKGDAVKLEDWVNNNFIPMLNTYHGFNIVGKWKLNENKKEELKEQFERDLELIKTGKYILPVDYLIQTYGMPVEAVVIDMPEPDPKGTKPEDVKNELKKKALSVNPINILENENFCDICAQIESNDVPEPIYTDDFIDDIVKGVFTGTYAVDNLPEKLYLRIADEIEKGMFNGLNSAGGLEVFDDELLVKALRNNAFKFSGAKTFQQVREMSDFVAKHAEGVISIAEYEQKAKEIFGTYNKVWLRTEIAQASNTAQMASKWQEIEEDKDLFPFLKYDTVGDAVVRPDHAALDGVIKPVNSRFWDTYYPPNGWNCRCDVQRLDEADPTKTENIDFPNVPDSMKFNAGKKKVLFSPEHPYFEVAPQFSELKKNNFNLSKPKPLKVDKNAPISLKGWKGKHKYGTLKGKKLEIQKHLEKETGEKIPDSLIENASEDLTLLNESKDGPHYDPFKKDVFLDHKKSHWGKKDGYTKRQLIAHELGHSNHFNTRELLSHHEKSKEFTLFIKAFDDELTEIAETIKNTRGRGKAKSLRKISGEVETELSDSWNNIFTAKTQTEKDAFKRLKSESGALSDTLQGFSRGNFGSGHDKIYQKQWGELEIWAHLSENYYVGNNTFEKYLPKTYNAGLKYFEDYLKRNQ